MQKPGAEKPSGISHVAIVTGNLDGFRAFYEDTIGLDTTMVFNGGPGHSRQAILMAGDAMLHVFEVADFDPAVHGDSLAMFERGRIDHLGFSVPDLPTLTAVRDRLLAVGASSGDIHQLGPMYSLRFIDSDGLESEINCYNPDFDPNTVRDEDEIVDPGWLERTRHALQARPAQALSPSRPVNQGQS
jgi:catechol 2,3-dioxygenase-like lactoylglutathione lyase family enzyme